MAWIKNLYHLITDIMPDKFDTPMFWDEEDLAELKGTAVVVGSLCILVDARSTSDSLCSQAK